MGVGGCGEGKREKERERRGEQMDEMDEGREREGERR